MTVKNSEPYEKDASVDAPSAATGATAVEEDVEADAGTTVARARSGATGLVRTAGRISLARAPGGINLVRIVLRATPVSLHCRYHQEGTTTTTKTRGWWLPGAACHRLHLGRSSSPSVTTYLQAVC